MKKLIIFIVLVLVLNFSFAREEVKEKLKLNEENIKKLEEVKEEFKPGKTTVTWTPVRISICPPGIFGSVPCKYPSLIDLIKRINNLLRTIAPPLLVILIILGGLMYLLSPLGVEEHIKKGHRYIIYAVYGYILLLLVSLIFTIISVLFGGPQ